MTRIFALVVCFGLLLPAAARAQAPAVDPIRELLTEVRALRIAMERSATVGARIQLLVARVQLQEQRIAELSRRAAAVRDELSKIDSGVVGLSAQLKQMEKALESGSGVDDRKDLEAMIEQLKAQLAVPNKRRQDLLDEESLLSQQMAADQGRWSDVNSQLDDLERSLALPIKQ